MASEQERPNIVLITMDTARARNLSCYGYEKNTTPFLDELAEENVKYEHAVTQAPWTLPSHASIFSGDYITRHGRYSKDKSFEDLDTVTEDLSEKGYRNIALTNIAYLSEDFGFDQLFDSFHYVGGKSLFKESEIIDEALEGEKEGRWDGTVEKYFDLLTDAVRDGRFKDLVEGAAYVFGKYFFAGDDGASKTNQLAKQEIADSESPFFLFLNYMEPHAPYRPPFPYSHKFQENKLAWKKLLDISSRNMHKYASEKHEPSDELLRVQEDLYNGELRYLDRRIKELYEHIKREHPDTVFIVTSDHGEYFYENGLVNHFGDVHEPVSHVPLIEAFPGEVDGNLGGTVELRALSEHLVSLAEGEFTCLESEEYAITEYYGAQSSLWDIPEEFTGEDIERLSRYKAAGYHGEKKLIAYSDGERKLYRLPDEQQEIDDESTENQIEEHIEDEVGKPEEKEYESEEQEVEEEIKDSLEELGYM